MSLKNSSFLKLPFDPVEENYTRQVLNACYSYVEPSNSSNIDFFQLNQSLLKKLKANSNKIDWQALLSGQIAPKGVDCFAMNYGGHQFGQWAGQLGDGRAMNIGEINGHQLQLKGSGKTPYSRNADGKAVVRSSIREYLMAEATHHLGIPTTRSLSITTLDEKIERDMLYNGKPDMEQAAIICRVAPAFIRFGNFQLHSARKEFDILKQLTDYTISDYFPSLQLNGRQKYIAFFKEVSSLTLELVLHWQRVGFVHGVLNTDNMSILGLTLDYGPFGFLDAYDPMFTPNLTDFGGRRYRFENQPIICQWNLYQLANALYPLIEDAEPLENILQEFQENYYNGYQKMMSEKLGLKSISNEKLISQLEEYLQLVPTDFIIFFQQLAEIEQLDHWQEKIAFALYKPLNSKQKQKWQQWFELYFQKLCEEKVSFEERKTRMNQVSPRYILRNYMLYQCIEEFQKGNKDLFFELEEMSKNPYTKNAQFEKWFAKKPDWADDTVGSSVLSCSS